MIGCFSCVPVMQPLFEHQFQSRYGNTKVSLCILEILAFKFVAYPVSYLFWVVLHFAMFPAAFFTCLCRLVMSH